MARSAIKAQTEGIQLYSGRVRIAGSLLNEVPKPEMSAEEIYIYRQEHGDDSVVELTPVSNPAEITHFDDRERLRRIFGDAKVDKYLGSDDAPRAIRIKNLPEAKAAAVPDLS